MLPLYIAIKTWFDQDTDLTAAIPGGIWQSEADESAVAGEIYLVITTPVAPVETGYGWQTGQPVLQFAAFGEDFDAVGQAMALFTTKLNQATLSLISGDLFNYRQLGFPIPSQKPHDEQGQDYWQWTCQYLFEIEL